MPTAASLGLLLGGWAGNKIVHERPPIWRLLVGVEGAPVSELEDVTRVCGWRSRASDDITLEHLSVGHRTSTVGLSPGRHALRALAVELRWTRRTRPLSGRGQGFRPCSLWVERQRSEEGSTRRTKDAMLPPDTSTFDGALQLG